MAEEKEEKGKYKIITKKGGNKILTCITEKEAIEEARDTDKVDQVAVLVHMTDKGGITVDFSLPVNA